MGAGLIVRSGGARNRVWLLLWGLLLMVGGSLLAHRVQTSGGIRVLDVRFVGTGGTAMGAFLFIPPNATSETPAPGILAVHGYFNSRETQADFAIEFARRGYVVLALDQTGHGRSDPPTFKNGFGGPDGLRYLRSLDIVDKDNIGLEGHSMGGWTVVTAAAAVPDGYKSIVLEGSSTGPPFTPEGTTQFPRNLAVVFAQHDEFAPIMWNVPTGTAVTQSPKLWKQFGSTAPVEPGKVYGSIEEGTARVLFTPGGTHPWNHLSRTAIGNAIDWFQQTLKGGSPRPATDQIWQWKEFGTLIALCGFVAALLGVLDALLRLPLFAPLRGEPVIARQERSTRWWITLAACALLPAVTLLPFAQLGSLWMPASRLFPQAFSNEIVVWALLNAVLVVCLALLPGTTRAQPVSKLTRSALLALTTATAGYAAVVLLYAFFLVDLRYWFIAFRPLQPSQFGTFLAYLVPFVVFFYIVLRALHANLAVATHSPARQYVVNLVALAGGFVLFLAVQYGLLFGTGQMLGWFMNDPLRTVIAINFVPLMAIVAVLATFTWRRTGSHVAGAFLSALLIAWYLVAGQATQV
jgi:pimeloyl-ACP methyl ester carboxylesterase